METAIPSVLRSQPGGNQFTRSNTTLRGSPNIFHYQHIVAIILIAEAMNSWNAGKPFQPFVNLIFPMQSRSEFLWSLLLKLRDEIPLRSFTLLELKDVGYGIRVKRPNRNV